MQFFFAPVIGVLSDRYGRRPIILLSNFGLGLDYIIMALAPTIWWLFAGRLLSGITSSSGPTANAYISDVTTPRPVPALTAFSALRSASASFSDPPPEAGSVTSTCGCLSGPPAHSAS